MTVALCAPASAQERGNAPLETVLSWKLPEGWEPDLENEQKQTSQLKVPGGLRVVINTSKAGEGESAQGLIKRWLGQIEPVGEQSAAEVAIQGLMFQHHLAVRTLDVSGTHVAKPRSGSGDLVRAPKSRLLAAVVEGWRHRYSVELVGDEAKVAAQVKAFTRFLSSLSAGSRLDLRIHAPATWDGAPGSNSLRCAEMGLPGEVSLTVYHFGLGVAGVEQIFDRWLAQLTGPTGAPVRSKRGSFKTEALEVFTLDASGTYASDVPDQPKVVKPGQRLLGAVVVGLLNGPYFFKLVGPEAAEQFEAYQTLLRKGLEILE